MASKARRNRCKQKRQKKHAQRQQADNITCVLGKCSQTDRPFVIGMVGGKVVYTSKVLNSHNHAGAVKQRWLRRAAVRFCRKPSLPPWARRGVA